MSQCGVFRIRAQHVHTKKGDFFRKKNGMDDEDKDIPVSSFPAAFSHRNLPQRPPFFPPLLSPAANQLFRSNVKILGYFFLLVSPMFSTKFLSCSKTNNTSKRDLQGPIFCHNLVAMLYVTPTDCLTSTYGIYHDGYFLDWPSRLLPAG